MPGFQVYVVADPEALRPVLSDEAGLFTMPARAFTRLMGTCNVLDKKDVHGPWVRDYVVVVASILQQSPGCSSSSSSCYSGLQTQTGRAIGPARRALR